MQSFENKELEKITKLRFRVRFRTNLILRYFILMLEHCPVTEH